MKGISLWLLSTVWRFLFQGWTWRMAWRDTRRSRRHLLLCSASIIFGVAALVAVGSLGKNLEQAIESQAKALLGADLVLGSREALTEGAAHFVESLGGVQTREVSFSSMVFFPKNEGTRLVQVRALDPGFPFYGKLETAPATAATEFRARPGALVEESVMKQFGLAVGDRVKIGEETFPVLGSILKVPGETASFATIAPRVYVPLADLQKTKLLQKGSLVRYRVYLKLRPEVNVPALVKRLQPQLDQFHLDVDTVEHRKLDLGRAMTNLYHFLNLVGFVALLLGGIGIASAIHVHIKQKLATVAVLRSLGCASGQVFAVYLAQGFGLAVVGVGAGIALGLILQLSLPRLLVEFVPFPVAATLSGSAIGSSAGVGLSVCLLFTLLPLLVVRRIPPLAVLRASFEPQVTGVKDPWVWVCYGVIGVAVAAFSISQSQRWTTGLAFAAGAGLAFALLLGLAQGLVRGLRRYLPRIGPFTLRQGLASLHRPNNRSVLLVLSLGLGTFLILSLHLLQRNLVGHLLPAGHQNKPDAVLFDIQSDQKPGVVQLLDSLHLPVLQEAPMVTMRLASIKGRATEQLRKDPRRTIPNWALRREYRSTYREHLVDSEKLLAGAWHGRIEPGTSPVPVSVEEEIAKTLGVQLGDELVFDVQGVPVKTVVASLREVDWRRLQPNFFVVFPLGVLEEAPCFHILVTRAGSSDRSAQMQREVVKQFPNVSVIDLTLVLQTVESIVQKISFVVRFMALFTVGTGLLVLVTSILTGRYQRLQESVLLRTLGASRQQIRQILVVEYFCLGSLAAFTAILLAAGAGWALTRFVFKVEFTLPPGPLLATLLIVCGSTVLVGLLASRGVSTQPPLEVLRREV